MQFKMDQQSYRDLNVFTESSDSAALFSLFKHTKTLGGREKMLEVMHNPSSSIDVITARKESIAYFCKHPLDLKLSREELDLTEHYLKNNKIFLRSNIIDATYDFLSNKLKATNDYYIITVGIKYIVKLLNYIAGFTEEHFSSGVPKYLISLSEKINTIIESGGLKKIRMLDHDRLKYYQISQLDHLFRRKEKDSIKAILELAYELDVFETVSFVARDKGFCFPEYLDSTAVKVSIEGLYHPAIKNAVRNDLRLEKEKNVVFLSGSNMAGKSSLLKSLGMCVYLAHLGFPVPAVRMETTIFNGLITTINLPDNLNQGLSHYYSEVKRVKEAASTLLGNDRMFIIFDELFRGTNVKDAYDASLLIISELSAINSSVFYISTHIVELAEALKNISNISFKYMETFFNDSKPVFTYQLRDGVSTERLGMYIVENEGIIDIIREAARRCKD
ncbi:MutS-related protein [Pedobacter metabolipauper]|uniref:MutS-like protein n=1 Tax=Pedobacter metabolipauper TaxID=425513 RepID=A0A4R6SWN3_9SPHI|nr:hypothetical protein [Pedobacter metabolipauper]TDQ08811.1 MutS-like protein [Pedobacter metabolipauper]